MFTTPSVTLYPINRPGDGPAQLLPQHRPAGLAYGRQTFKCPLTRTALPQLTHKNAVRQKNHIHMAGLALAGSELTVAHAQMLLAVPMEALHPTPAAAVNAEYSTYLPLLTTHVERKGRYTVAVKVEDKSADTVRRATLEAMRKLPAEKVRTMTFDNGKEFAGFKGLEREPGI